jgi:Glycosyltransferase
MQMPNSTVLLIEGSDFETFPAGGQLTMSRALMKLFGDRLALVGMNRGNGPIGEWTLKEIGGRLYWFFPVTRRNVSGRKPLIPARLSFYAGLRRFKRKILSLGSKAAFIQAPEALMAVAYWNWHTVCFWFPGVENPLNISRYPFAGKLSRAFDKAFFRALGRVSVVLGAADEVAIRALVSRSNGHLSRERLIQLPTCVDMSLFHPESADRLRLESGIRADCKVFVNVGRISRPKGWELLLDAFEEFLTVDRNALLIFVGDGEDRPLLQAQVERRSLESRVRVTGFQTSCQVASYLRLANAVVFGSFVEGWSVALLEALACGKAIVSTEVSGAANMIRPGQNGFIVKDRNPSTFAEAMRAVLTLADAERVSTSIAADFDITRLGERLANLWAPFADAKRHCSPGVLDLTNDRLRLSANAQKA